MGEFVQRIVDIQKFNESYENEISNEVKKYNFKGNESVDLLLKDKLSLGLKQTMESFVKLVSDTNGYSYKISENSYMQYVSGTIKKNIEDSLKMSKELVYRFSNESLNPSIYSDVADLIDLNLKTSLMYIKLHKETFLDGKKYKDILALHNNILSGIKDINNNNEFKESELSSSKILNLDNKILSSENIGTNNKISEDPYHYDKKSDIFSFRNLPKASSDIRSKANSINDSENHKNIELKSFKTISPINSKRHNIRNIIKDHAPVTGDSSKILYEIELSKSDKTPEINNIIKQSSHFNKEERNLDSETGKKIPSFEVGGLDNLDSHFKAQLSNLSNIIFEKKEAETNKIQDPRLKSNLSNLSQSFIKKQTSNFGNKCTFCIGNSHSSQ